MLVEPQDDPKRLGLEQAIVQAVIARQNAGPRSGPDADAIALRSIMAGLTQGQKASVKAVIGRMEAGLGRPLMACGGIAQLLAADRWGPFARPIADQDHALQAASQGARVLMDIGQRPWWGKLLAMPSLRVIAALPDDANARPRTLMISSESTGPSGDDRTFWVTDSADSDASIIEHLSANGLAADLVASAGGLKLFILNGYVQAEDGRLLNAPGTLQGIIGAAPLF